MILNLIKKIKNLKSNYISNIMYKKVELINELEKKIKKLNDKNLSNKTNEFKYKIKNGYKINDILTESYAVVREASRRITGMRHYDVQILGGIALNYKYIIEMSTGEGKTLTSTLPAYLNALNNKGVHIITTNDYLAKRDAYNNKKLFNFLGLSVGTNLKNMNKNQKKNAYLCDITYGTNNEFCFDYLKDNMIYNIKNKVQRKLHFSIIDEIDSILIDEAKTPLIISNSLKENTKEIYKKIYLKIINKLYSNKNIKNTKNLHYYIDNENKQINLTNKGYILIEKLLKKFNFINIKENLYNENNIIYLYYITTLLKAKELFFINVDYIIKNKKIIIIDENTGRIMPEKRWSDGIHQALETKENLKINNENETVATITFQNYFKLYKKISGMTGTAITESHEFNLIYNLNTISIPTNKPMIRKDLSDLIYLSEKEKIKAIIKDVIKRNKKKQPILIGTTSIKKSELISKKLKKNNIKHNILNAKFHSKEAKIISQAGKPNSVTIATNIAGRGVDIILGGKKNTNKKKNKNKKKIKLSWKKKHNLVIKSGGLHIIGTERNESRRIDNQLIGRSGRQGNIGSSQFYLSIEDELIKTFISNNIIKLIKKLNIKKNKPIKHKLINKIIENAQKKIENTNFEIRKQSIEFDNIINEQRLFIYKLRNKILKIKNINILIKKIISLKTKKIIYSFYKKYKIKKIKFNEFKKLKKKIKKKINNNIRFNTKNVFKNKKNKIKIFLFYKKNIINLTNNKKYKNKKNNLTIKKNIFLLEIDKLWKNHLNSIEYLKKGIHLRGYANKDPKQEYKKESFNIFSKMIKKLNINIINKIINLFQ